MWQFIVKAFEIMHERAKTHKALRLLSKQEWSVEFLTAMLVRAANITQQPLEMTISNGQQSLRISTLTKTNNAFNDDDIFNHLDDENKIKQFMEQVR